MKKACLAVVCAFLLASSVPADAGKPGLVASRYSDRYHLPTCKIAKKIGREDLLTFDSPEMATATGLVPCRKCSPPASSKTSD